MALRLARFPPRRCHVVHRRGRRHGDVRHARRRAADGEIRRVHVLHVLAEGHPPDQAVRVRGRRCRGLAHDGRHPRGGVVHHPGVVVRARRHGVRESVVGGVGDVPGRPRRTASPWRRGSPRFPPDAVTSYTVEAVASVTSVTVAVVPPMAKSAASTFFTSSLKVTLQIRLSAFVGEDVGVWRTMDATVGAVLSTTQVLSFVPAGAGFERALSALSAMSWPPAKDSVTVASRSREIPARRRHVVHRRGRRLGDVRHGRRRAADGEIRRVHVLHVLAERHPPGQAVRVRGEKMSGVWRTMDATLGAVVSTTGAV